ncbi:MAG: hypothetical protein ACPLZ9_04475, partial [Candidatus Ratteibacteria bacterium]
MNKNGVLTFITPDKWLTKPFGQELRKGNINKLCSLLKCGRKIFESSNVDAIISIFSERTTDVIKIFKFKNNHIILKNTVNKNILAFPYNLDFLFSNYLDLVFKIESMPFKLRDFGLCDNACATSDAYKLKPLIKELKNKNFDKDKLLKVINTGTIGKYYSKWGKQKMIYLGDKYLFPVVEKRDFIKTFNKTYINRAQKPKIVIKGLTLLEGCIDSDGSVIPGKSTLIIESDNIDNLKFLLAIINSKVAFFYIKEKYASYSYNQGINFNKDMINNLPIPEVKENEKEIIISLVSQILSLTQSSD